MVASRMVRKDVSAHHDSDINSLDLDFTSLRKVQTRFNRDGSATVHVSVHCTLDSIAKATCIRPEDVAFALNECGLLRFQCSEDNEKEEGGIILSREIVEQVAERWKPRQSLILPEHLHLRRSIHP